MLNTSRGDGIFSPIEFRDKKIHIVGLGNIGSHTAIALARMGFTNFVLYDFDKVEDVNISTQAFNKEHKDMLKIEAVEKEMLKINKDCNITCVNIELNEECVDLVKDLISNTLCFICGVDSLGVRKTLKKLLLDCDCYCPIIDGRLGKQQVEVLFSKEIKNWDVDVAEDTLAGVGCTEKYIAYTPLMCAALISGTVKRLCLEEKIPNETIFEFQSNQYITILKN